MSFCISSIISLEAFIASLYCCGCLRLFINVGFNNTTILFNIITTTSVIALTNSGCSNGLCSTPGVFILFSINGIIFFINFAKICTTGCAILPVTPVNKLTNNLTNFSSFSPPPLIVLILSDISSRLILFNRLL